MINKKWLIASLFIPLFGGIINLIICVAQFHKLRNTEKNHMLTLAKYFSWGLVLAGAFVITMAAFAIFIGVIGGYAGLAFGDWIFPVAVVVAGFVANVVFFFYYRKRIQPFFELDKQLGDDNDDQVK